MKEQSGMASDDQMFLLYFIMGSYFGPHLKAETPPKSVLQRIAEGLPPYTFDQLAASQITTQEIQQLYYHVVRNAHHSVVAQLPLLQHFFHGNLFIEGPNNYPQFPDLFPPLLHYNSQSRTRFNFFENIVFNRNPEVSYIRPQDLERFKRLTALKGLSLDIDSEPNSNGSSIITNHVDDILECKDLLKQSSVIEYSATPVTPTGNGSDDMQQVDPAITTLTQKEWSDIVAATKHGFALTGQIGPTIGLIDIGESEDSYLFRVSLPGVRRDEREFSCEVDNEGQVLIRGVTITGEKTVYRYSQIFEMQTQNLCPTGHFSISFQLPGPVNPLQFLGNFGTDGILEGVVMKRLDDKGCLC